MAMREVSMAAVGFVQTFSLTGTAHGQIVFGDDLCQEDQGTCFDAGCTALGGQCRVLEGMTQDQQGQAAGCVCDEPPRCRATHGLLGDQCLDFSCSEGQGGQPGFHCDLANCDCVPDETQPTTTTTQTQTSMTQTTTTTSTQTIPPTQVVDHLKCYKIRDRAIRDSDGNTLAGKLRGIIDLTSAQFGVETDCKIGKPTKFCVPVLKTVKEVNVILPTDPYVGHHLFDDRICYKIKCPAVDIAQVDARDQFGDHNFQKFKAAEVCTPAIKLP